MKPGTRISVVYFEVDTETTMGPFFTPAKPTTRIRRRFVRRAHVVAARVWGVPEQTGAAHFRCVGEPARGGVIRLDREGTEWAHGWRTHAARALCTAVALS